MAARMVLFLAPAKTNGLAHRVKNRLQAGHCQSSLAPSFASVGLKIGNRLSCDAAAHRRFTADDLRRSGADRTAPG